MNVPDMIDYMDKVIDQMENPQRIEPSYEAKSMYLMIGDSEYYIEFEYEYIRGYGATELQPAEPSTVEISKVKVDFSEESMKRDMVEIDLPPQVIRDLELETLEHIEA